MSYQLQYVNFSGYSLHVSHVCNPALLQNLDCNFLLGQFVSSHANFTESALSDLLIDVVVANDFLSDFGLFLLYRRDFTSYFHLK